MVTKKGFTLIELLVVISIIALLMAVLIPALRAAKETAAGAVCVSNLHNLATAYFTYAVENDDEIVDGDAPSSASDFEQRKYWVTPPMDAGGTYSGTSPLCNIEDKKRGIRNGTLFPYIKDVEVYNCPVDKRYRRPPSDPSYDFVDGGYRTYSIPDGVNGDQGYKYLIKRYSQIKKPAEKYVFVEENDMRGWNKGSWALEDIHDRSAECYKGWIDPIATYHNEKSTLGWADGHATIRRWVEKPTVKLAKMMRWGPPSDPDTVQGYRESTDHTGSKDLIFMKEHWPCLGN